MTDWIRLRGASENNLRGINVQIPRGSLTVLTGVSGSGKSSLAIETLYREGSRRYLETFSGHARQFMGKLRRPSFESLTGLPPAIAVGQWRGQAGPRSTVGTLSEVLDYLRLLYARFGRFCCPCCGMEVVHPVPQICTACHGVLIRVSRALFSFNAQVGRCPSCKGLGEVDRIDPNLLISNEELTLRQGVLVPTLESGYIMYSQVTMEALDTVCRAHGFDVDRPWRELSEDQRSIIYYGSDRVRIPLGKHTLESRLKWTGMTAKPRPEGFYKGIVTVLEDILYRDRTPGVLRFARTQPCPSCRGSRLRPEALQVTVGGINIATFVNQDVSDATLLVQSRKFCEALPEAASPVLRAITDRLNLLNDLGLEYLTLDRPAASLSAGEWQRIRLASQVSSGLNGVLVVLDEPSVGLHEADLAQLLSVLYRLRDNGNTVVVVEHNELVMRAADWLVDVGPGSGTDGGKLLWSGPVGDYLGQRSQNPSPTWQLLGKAGGWRPEAGGTAKTEEDDRRGHQGDSADTENYSTPGANLAISGNKEEVGGGEIRLVGVATNNLRGIDAAFKVGAVNVVTGKAGAGKKSLVLGTLVSALTTTGRNQRTWRKLSSTRPVDKVICVDHSPIGRTPRSNPATYTKLFDVVRKLFSDLPEARDAGLGKGHFSFNNSGGRCETCQGAGVETIGMHFLGDVRVVCPECGGRRFNELVLAVRLNGNSISDVLAMTVADASRFFAGNRKAARILGTLIDVGLEYLQLGQPSPTLSGGEAQRVKLASELVRPATGHTLYVMIEPTTGLHPADVSRLNQVFRTLAGKGQTVVLVDNDLDVIRAADHVVDLGPGRGAAGGRIVASGTPAQICAEPASLTGAALMRSETETVLSRAGETGGVSRERRIRKDIRLLGVSTNNLKSINVTIPVGRMTVMTGVSGSGKSSLAFETLYAEGRRRFSGGLSAYAMQFVNRMRRPDLEQVENLPPAVAIDQRRLPRNPRSTVGTMTGVLELLRLLWARVGRLACSRCGGRRPVREPACGDCGMSGDGVMLASHFSSNHTEGACPVCKGLGFLLEASPEQLVTHPDLSLNGGAMKGTKAGLHYGDPRKKFIHILRAAGSQAGLDFDRPWAELDEAARYLAMFGAGDTEFVATWQFERGGQLKTHTWTSAWPGFVKYVTDEFEFKLADGRARHLGSVMVKSRCRGCAGERLREKAGKVMVAGLTLPQLASQSVQQALDWLTAAPADFSKVDAEVWQAILPRIQRRLELLAALGLDYLSLDREAGTLSGGEGRRVQLVNQVAEGLTGVVYVLDEPTLGLHSRDTGRLLDVLGQLQNQGNTLVVVEHDEEFIRAADYMLDLGPGAGEQGGRVMASGSPAEIAANPDSVTGKYLRKKARSMKLRTDPSPRPSVVITGIHCRNLDIPELVLPMGRLVAISGVSGSGKSTLLNEVLAPVLATGSPVGCRSVLGLAEDARVVVVDQLPIGQTPASTPATYTGIMDLLRKRFAATEEAHRLNLTAAAFSSNNKLGSCSTCKGIGQVKVNLDFLADVWIPCEECGGDRYVGEVLECRLGGRNVAEWLRTSVEDAANVFRTDRKLATLLEMLVSVGLGYLPLGQPVTTLSGGELQRLKLATELTRRSVSNSGQVFYLLDEPTCGLHMQDVEQLIGLLRRLVTNGHTVVVVEHHLDVIRHADHIVDLGPEGGPNGGRLVAAGPPAAIAACPQSHTGVVLKKGT
jgi:excinuclease ABC subunit A